MVYFYVFSLDYQSPEQSVRVRQSFPIKVIRRDDLQIYNSSLKQDI